MKLNEADRQTDKQNTAKGRSIGGAYIRGTSLSDASNDYNGVFAVDGTWGIGKKAKISGFISKSNTPVIFIRIVS